MIHSIGTYRRGLVGLLAVLLVSAATATAQAGPPKLSDTIQLKNGQCTIKSVADDIEAPPEFGLQHCKFFVSPNGFIQVSVPGNKDDTIVCSCKLQPNGTISGPGREGQGPGAYSVTILGNTKPGTTWAGLMAAGAIIRVLEPSGAP
jgi:hypothetical protein